MGHGIGSPFLSFLCFLFTSPLLDLQPAKSINAIKKKTCTYLNKTFKMLLLRIPKIDK